MQELSADGQGMAIDPTLYEQLKAAFAAQAPGAGQAAGQGAASDMEAMLMQQAAKAPGNRLGPGSSQLLINALRNAGMGMGAMSDYEQQYDPMSGDN